MAARHCLIALSRARTVSLSSEYRPEGGLRRGREGERGMRGASCLCARPSDEQGVPDTPPPRHRVGVRHSLAASWQPGRPVGTHISVSGERRARPNARVCVRVHTRAERCARTSPTSCSVARAQLL
ncbi:unnamed protein product, partial [Iphiclides podalirius]